MINIMKLAAVQWSLEVILHRIYYQANKKKIHLAISVFVKISRLFTYKKFRYIEFEKSCS